MNDVINHTNDDNEDDGASEASCDEQIGVGYAQNLDVDGVIGEDDERDNVDGECEQGMALDRDQVETVE